MNSASLGRLRQAEEVCARARRRAGTGTDRKAWRLQIPDVSMPDQMIRGRGDRADHLWPGIEAAEHHPRAPLSAPEH